MYHIRLVSLLEIKETNDVQTRFVAPNSFILFVILSYIT